MVHVSLTNVGVEFQVMTDRERSFRRTLVQAATGGLLQLTNRRKVFISGLKDVNLQMMPGERLGLMGHNGAGKTTLLRVLNGVFIPTSGDAVVSGTIASLIDVSLGMDPEASGMKNIYLRGAMLGLSRRLVDERIDEIVEFSGLGEFIDMPVRTYSTGMELRLSFSVSTIATPDILVMDEWLSVGDDSFRAKAQDRLTQMVSEAKILALASHSRRLLELNCTRGLVLEHGRVIKDAPIQEATEFYFSNERIG